MINYPFLFSQLYCFSSVLGFVSAHNKNSLKIEEKAKMHRKRKHEDTSDMPSVAESWSRTEQYTVKGRHQWTIDNFLHRAQFTEVGDSLCSPIFGVPVDVFGTAKPQELLFQLEVFPNGKLNFFTMSKNCMMYSKAMLIFLETRPNWSIARVTLSL